MTAAMKKPVGSARDRIVSVASDLFYKQGYRATGINEVIEKSGVAKATFYNHFPSKDILCKECLLGLQEKEMLFVENAIQAADNMEDKFLSVISSLEVWAIDTEFRGCAFLNMAAEVPDATSSLRKVGMDLYDQIKLKVEVLAKELIDSDTKKYGHLQFEALTRSYMVAFAGAVALTEIYNEIWPVHDALQSMRRMIGK